MHTHTFKVSGFRVRLRVYVRCTPHPVIVTIRGNKEYIWVLLIFLVYLYDRVGILLSICILVYERPVLLRKNNHRNKST